MTTYSLTAFLPFQAAAFDLPWPVPDNVLAGASGTPAPMQPSSNSPCLRLGVNVGMLEHQKPGTNLKGIESISMLQRIGRHTY